MNHSRFSSVDPAEGGMNGSFDEQVEQAWASYLARYAWTARLLDRLVGALLVLGVLGNALALLTMLCSRPHMTTPSFVYHKALVAADLLYCLNFLLTRLMEHTQRVYLDKVLPLCLLCHETSYPVDLLFEKNHIPKNQN